MQACMMEQAKEGRNSRTLFSSMVPPHRPMGSMPPAWMMGSGVQTGKQPIACSPVSFLNVANALAGESAISWNPA